jgi:DNA-directed RNA polymerase specialized sigma24 family protein
MTRRITSSRFNWYARRYDAMLKTTVRGVLDKGDDRTATSVTFDELMVEAQKSLLYVLIHFDRTRSNCLTTYLFARVEGQLRNLKRGVARQVRKITTADNDDLATECAAGCVDAETRAHVNELLACLTQIEAEVIVESFMWDKSARRLAEERGLTHDFVWRVRERARRRLREKFPDLIVIPAGPAPEAVVAS